MDQVYVRETLKKMYPNKKWSDKVDGMSDSQVIAVYVRLTEQNAIKEKK